MKLIKPLLPVMSEMDPLERKVYRALIQRMGGENRVSESGEAMAYAIAHWAALNEIDESVMRYSLSTVGLWIRDVTETLSKEAGF